VTHPTQTTLAAPAAPAAPSTLPAMIGLDLGDQHTHYCVMDRDQRVLDRGRFRTTPEGVRKAFADWHRSSVVMEAGSQSPWISALLGELGYEVLVVDPRKIDLISRSPRKTDTEDAKVLAELALGVPRLLGRVTHRGPAEQAALSILRSRDLVVRMRTKAVLHVRGMCKAAGVRLGDCSAESFHRKVLQTVPERLLPALKPVLEVLSTFEQQIKVFDKQLKQLTLEYPVTTLLQQVNGVGLITSLVFVLTIGDPNRFQKSRDVGSYFGLCPKVRQSGDSNPQLRITKCGDPLTRRTLVQAAHYILGPFGHDSDLRRYGQRLHQRGGKAAKKRAVIAVARKLAILLHRLWVTGEAYEPLRNSTALLASETRA
jgi:transposase